MDITTSFIRGITTTTSTSQTTDSTTEVRFHGPNDKKMQSRDVTKTTTTTETTMKRGAPQGNGKVLGTTIDITEDSSVGDWGAAIDVKV